MLKGKREPKSSLSYVVKKMDISEITKTLGVFNLKTIPREHQARSFYLALDQDCWLLALDMGLGKSKIAMDIITSNKRINGKVRAFITCPPMVVRQLGNEAKKHSELTVQLVDGSNFEEKKNQLLHTKADVTIASHQWVISFFKKLGEDAALKTAALKLLKTFDILVVDECSVLLNPATKSFKGYRKYLLKIKKRYLMTGTPISNNYIGVWSLYYILDRGKTFGTSFNKFVREYFNVYFNARFYRYTLKKEKRKEFFEKFWQRAIRWEESECSELPEKTYSIIPLTLSIPQIKKYKEFVDEGGIDTGGYEFDLMKITSGIGFKESPKLMALKEIVKEVCVENGRQLIVWCWLRDESDYLVKELKSAFKKLRVEAVKGERSNKEKNQIISDWEKGKVKILIANQKTLGSGVDLFQANTCVFFSNNRSLIDRKQAEKRIHRIGQKRHCFYIDLVCENTIDVINLGILERAGDSFNALLKDKDDKNLVLAQTENLKRLLNK